MTIFVPRMPIDAEGVINRADSGLILAIRPDVRVHGVELQV